MKLTVDEMELFCGSYMGTIDDTLELLRRIKNRSPEKMAVVGSLIEKLSGMEEGETISLTFEPEN